MANISLFSIAYSIAYFSAKCKTFRRDFFERVIRGPP